MILELVSIVASTALFLVPGILLSTILVPSELQTDSTTRLFYSLVASAGFAIVVGLTLGSLAMLSRAIVLLVYSTVVILYIISLLVARGNEPYLIRQLFKKHVKIQRESLWQVIPFVVALLFGVTYLVFQNQYFPRGHDGSMHYIHMVQLLQGSGIGQYEIGTAVAPYYPRGYHFGAAVFCLITGSDPALSLLGFNTALFSFLSLAIYAFTKPLVEDARVAALSSICFFVIARVFIIQGSYPMVLSLFFIGTILNLIFLSIKGSKFQFSAMCFAWLMFVGIISIHPVALEILLLFLSGVYGFQFVLRFRINSLRPVLDSLTRVFVISLLAIGFLFLVQTSLLIGELQFALLRLSEPAGPTDFTHALTYRTAVMEFLVLFVSPFLAPFIATGLMALFREKKDNLVSIVVVATALVLAQIIPLNGREPYILFFPMLSAAAIGMCRCLTFESRGSIRRYVPPVFICALVVFGALQLSYVAVSPISGGWTPLTTEDTSFCNHINTLGIHDEVIASVNHPSALLIQALTSNRVMYGDSRYYDLDSFRDIALLFLPNRTETVYNQVIAIWGITAIFVKSNWMNTTGLMSDLATWYPGSTHIEYGDHQIMMLNITGNAE